MKVAIGSDHGGFALKQDILTYLVDNGYEVTDLGCYSDESVDYPDFAKAVSQQLLDGKVEKGILICGTGIGISMAANRHSGIRAALCSEPFLLLYRLHFKSQETVFPYWYARWQKTREIGQFY